MTDVWVCTNCKSINRQRDTRCYSCGNRKDEVAAPEELAPTNRYEQAIAYRTRRAYSPTWPLGLIAGLLIAAVAVMGVYIVVDQYRLIGSLKEAMTAALATGDQGQVTAVLQSMSASPVQGWHFPLTVLGVLAFGAWLARVCVNIPLLGGGMPTWTPVKAFLYPIIPIVNFVKVPGMVQDAMYRLDPKAGGFFMVLAAFVGLFGSWVVSVIGSFVIAAGMVGDLVSAPTREAAAEVLGRLIDQSFLLGLITELMTAGGALLLAVIIWRVERRAGARNAEIEAGILSDPRFSPPAPGPGTVPVGAPYEPAPPVPAPTLDDAPLAAAAAPAVVTSAEPAPVVEPVAGPGPAPAPASAPAVEHVPAPMAAPSPGPAAAAESRHQPRSGVPVYRPTFDPAPAPVPEPASSPAPPATPPGPAAADDAGPMLPPPPPPA